MTRGIRATLVAGAASMAVGCAMPWGRLWVLGEDGITVVGGFGHGAQVVLPLAVLILVSALAQWRWAAVVFAGAALAYVAYAGAVLPDAVHDEYMAGLRGIDATLGEGAWRAATGVGWAFAMLGAVVACAGAVWIVVRWAGETSAPAVAPERV